MDTQLNESTILKVYYGKLGKSDCAKISLYGHTALNAVNRQSDRFTGTLSQEVQSLVDELINHIFLAAGCKWSVRYETGFHVGLGIGYECGKI